MRSKGFADILGRALDKKTKERPDKIANCDNPV
jgi:hypothetical protein